MSPSDHVELLESDADAETYRVAYDPVATTPTQAVASALESIAPDQFERGEPLYGAIDPEALDRFLAPSEKDEAADRRSVEFPYLGFRITVVARGYLKVRPADDREAGSK